MRKRSIIIATIGIVSLMFMSRAVHAATPMQLMNVSPSSTAIQVDPGGAAKQSVDVVNVGETTFKVSVSSSPYHVQNLSYDPQFTQLPGTVDASQWVHFSSPITGTVAPQKLFSVDYTVNVPVGTAPGGYYAVLFAETDITEGASSGVVTHGRVGDILYITVNGAVKSAGTATATAIPFILLDSPVSLGVIVGNQGGVHFQTTVNTTIKNVFGSTTDTFQSKAYVLPQTQRKLQTDWFPKASIGVYRIEQTVMLPEGPKQLATQTVIIIKPWVIIALIAIIIVIVTAGILNIRRTSLKRKHQAHDHKDN